MKSGNAKVVTKTLPATLLAVLVGTVLTAGAAWALTGSAGPGGDVPAEMICHGHGQKGLGDCVAGARGPGGGKGYGRGEGRGRGPGHGPGEGAHLRILDSMPGELALSDTQWAEVLAIMSETRDGMEPLEADRTRRHDALRDLMHAEQLDEDAIRASVMEMATVQAEMAVARAQTRARVVALLNPDQKQYLESFRADNQERRWRHREFRSQRRGAL